jgi:hypothetical protein
MMSAFTEPLRAAIRWTVARTVDWSVESQQQARRNAMVASTSLAQRRAERDDVEHFLAAVSTPATAPANVPAAAHS